MKRLLEKKKLICLIIFMTYISIVLKLTVFRFGFLYDKRQLNATIFIDLINVYRNVGTGVFLRLFLGNIGWFVPFGFFLPVLLKKERFSAVIITGFLFSLSIETLQYVFRKGVAELDDLILNTLGVVIGYLIYKLTLTLFRKRELRFRQIRSTGSPYPIYSATSRSTTLP
ncbi:MAG: VanZ family protein [Oscillospiraceae bacterium]|nr:VanZ family protein [Oscillospiraceae bacterium]